MFSIVSRSITRRTALHSVRYLSQNTPPSSRKSIKQKTLQNNETRTSPAPKPETSSENPKPQEASEPRKVTLSSLDFSPPEPEKEFQRTGAKSSTDTLTSGERQRRFISRIFLSLLAFGISAQTYYMGREWNEEELKLKKMKREDAPSTRWGRTKERFTDVFDYFNKPAWPELLPPPMPPPHHKPYTLLLSVDDLLVTSTWDREHGWRTGKRPGVDYFLGYMSQFYEIVIFSSQPYYIVEPILDKLDRYNFYINYRLYREATRNLNGVVVKDLSYLNRDLSKVIILDTHPEHVSPQPENAIIMQKWDGSPKDKGLVAMIPFLESIAFYKPPDVRPILKAYEGKNIPLEYAKIESEQKAKHVAEWQAKNKGNYSLGSGFSFSGLLGMGPSTPAQPKNAPPPTYLEQKRAEAQKNYADEMKFINDNKAELEKLLEQDRKAMAAQVPGSLWEAMEQITSNKPAVPPTSGAPTPVGTSTHPPGSVASAADKKTN